MAKKRTYLNLSEDLALLGLAALVVVGIVRSARKATVSPVPPSPPVVPTPTPTPSPAPVPEPTGDIDAPPFPFEIDEAKNVEGGQTKVEHDEWLGLMGDVMAASGSGSGPPTEDDYAEARDQAEIPDDRTIAGALTEEAFTATYGEVTIPKKAERGKGWQPFVDSWVRMHDLLKQKEWVSG